jgi:hypothetical protein
MIEKKTAVRILVGKSESNVHLRGLGIDGKIIFKQILNK